VNPLATIGYEGVSPEGFDAALVSAGIELVVDVRAVALSRRAGFSKKALAERLLAQGISYVHLRDLGDPKPGRDAARAGDLDRFRRIYGAHLETSSAECALRQLTVLATSSRVALLCFEADAAACHRSIVAARIAKSRDLSIVHLKVDAERVGDIGRPRANSHPREGVAAA
jgi:uncharacterized protein (DUF488 family)